MKLVFDKKVWTAIAFILLVYWPLSSQLFCMKYDIMDWFLPMRNLVGASLQEGLLPLWNPYTNLGYPLTIDPQSGALYPITWVLGYFWGYDSYAINAEYLLHLLLAFYGMKKLGRACSFSSHTALLLGISYACCGFFVANAQHLSWIISAAWLPFALAYYQGLCQAANWRDALGLSLVLFFMLTGGYPAFFIVIIYILAILFVLQIVHWLRQSAFVLIRRFLYYHLLAVIVFALQAGVFLIYFFEAMPLLLRSGGLTLKEAQFLPLSPSSLLSFVVPLISAGNLPFLETDISMANAYVGIVVLLLLTWMVFEKWDWKKGGLFLALLCFFGMALGEHFVLRGWLYHWVPLMDVFKYPALFRVFGILFLLLFLGNGLDKLLRQAPTFFGHWKRTLPLAFLTFGGIVLWLYSWSQTSLAWPDNFQVKSITEFIQADDPFRSILIQWPIQLCFLIATWFVFRFANLDRRLPYLVILIALDLFMATQANLCSTVISDARTSSFEAKTADLPNGFPIPQLPLIQVPHQGDGSFYPMWYNNNILKRLVAKNGYNNLKLHSYHLFDKLPIRDSLLHHQLAFLSPLSEEADPLPHSTAKAESLSITAFQPNHITANVELSEAAQINLLQADYPGWEVLVDGKVSPHFQVHDFFIGAKIPKGKHQIDFVFSPKNFRLYLGISALSFIFVLLALLFSKQASFLKKPQNEATQNH